MDQHRRYERRLALWLGATYIAIGLLAAALVVWSALKLGFRPAWLGRR